MRKICQFLLATVVCGAAVSLALAQSGAAHSVCPSRPEPGSVVKNPLDITSQNGVLKAGFTLKSEIPNGGFLQDCYIYESTSGPVEAPTLRLNPGDELNLTLTNRLSYLPPPPPQRPGTMMHHMMGNDRTNASDPCTGGTMVATSTNVHFHGLNVPPKCHQDEIVLTDIENTDPPFEYKFKVPKNDQPGMYWYHPHLHGQATLQLNGGAAGALIVGGIEKVKPEVAGLPERVFIIRQQFSNPNSWLPGPYQLTLNYEPAAFPNFPSPVIKMKPGQKEFWRVANASTQAFLALQVWFVSKPQKVEVVALDGIPLTKNREQTVIYLPPAGRAEFIVTGPAAHQAASFQNRSFNTGPIGNPNFSEELALIEASASAEEPPALPAAGAASTATARFAGLAQAAVTANRKIYFSEATNGSNGPTAFMITVDGHVPKVFSTSDPPAVVTKVGAVEDWTIENRSGETHAFHIHQIHFLFLEDNGKKLPDPELRDTVIVPAWNGKGPYPNVKLRMDFREPEIAGTFVFHCHVLDHEDGGMMAKIQVDPK